MSGAPPARPVVLVSRVVYKGIEQPASRSYSSRHLEVEAIVIASGCPASRAVDLIDQAVARRLGVKPMRLELAEKEVDRLERRKEDADRAARRLPQCEATLQAGRQKLAEKERELERLLAELDAVELREQQGQKKRRRASSAEPLVTSSVVRAEVEGGRRAVGVCRENLVVWEREHAQTDERARSAPHPTEIEEARAAVLAVQQDLARNLPDLPL